jgi:hypothetical protein
MVELLARRPALHSAAVRTLIAAVTAAAFLVSAPAAFAGDPIMPLAQVRAGMQCTGYSVVRGTDISSFGVEVIDVVDDRASGSGPRILVRVSGPAVDATGIGPGFSGSPIYCADAQGTQRNIGAISESVGEYGGKVVLATPIEAILGNPVDAPRAQQAGAKVARAKPLAAPLTVTGLTPRLGNALQRAAARRGRPVLSVPAGPLGSFPVQTLRPGSALGVGYASGDISVSALGTVAYTDGDRVWGFGHALDGVGARSLLLQDAYVFHVVNNPFAVPDVFGTYKYAAAGHDVGTLSNDAANSVVGRVGAPPATIPVRATATDLDSGAKRTVRANVADETGVDQPTGSSILSFVAPLAVTQAAGSVLGGSPARLTGRACFAISFAEAPEPVRFCNRYVTDQPDPFGAGNTVAGAASADLFQALALVDTFKAGVAHVTGVEADIGMARGQRQAFLRRVLLPRRGRAGKKLRATLVLQHVRGRVERRKVRLRLPSDLRPGMRRVVFTGSDVDLPGGGELFELIELEFGFGPTGGELGPRNLRRLLARIDGLARYDGVSARRPSSDPEDFDPGEPSYRDPNLRISGDAVASIRIKKRR